MPKFMLTIPEYVLEEAKSIAGMQDEPDDYFITRVLETMSCPEYNEYSDILVLEVKQEDEIRTEEEGSH